MGVFSKIFGSGRKSDFILALDIGTEVVKALIFQPRKTQDGEEGVVIGVGKVQQKLGNMQSGAVSDISGVVDTSQEAINLALQKA